MFDGIIIYNHIERRYSETFTISSLHYELSLTHVLNWPGPNHVQITCNTLRVYHVQHVVCHMVRKDSSVIMSD